jgi:hypothetical protein
VKDWYSGRYRDPLDRMTADELQTMYADCKEAHAAITWRMEQTRMSGEPVRAFVLDQERKRLAGIGAEIRRRVPAPTIRREAS